MIYLKERSSALIQYVTQDHAAIAKESLNDIMFYGKSIKIFFSNYEVISLNHNQLNLENSLKISKPKKSIFKEVKKHIESNLIVHILQLLLLIIFKYQI